MFCIAFGLSMDLLECSCLSRIREYWLGRGRTGHDSDESVALGLARTGRVVTAAALLMTISFAALLASPVSFVKMFGLGLAIAVLVDATVVRMLLLPALMRLLGRLNWWAPVPLTRLGSARSDLPRDLIGWNTTSHTGALTMGDTCDVIVVGAGPVGATAALLLADYGLKCIVVEVRRAPQSHPAAHVLSTRSMEIWREIGLERDIRWLSAPMHELRSVLYCTTLVGPELGRVPLADLPPAQIDAIESVSPTRTAHLPQNALEPLLWQPCGTMRASTYAPDRSTALTPTAQTASQ